MNVAELIKKAKTENRSTLTEAESKKVLAAYGVPVVEESIASSPAEAADLASKIGFPAVLKGLGARLTHKTELGLVKLGITDREDALRAAEEIGQAAGENLEGWLVQPQISGRREFVAGLMTDDQFGPVVMLGLGGVFTEALDDVTFRVAPVNDAQAEWMLEELKSAKLLGPFRGEAAADRKKIVEALTGLSRLGLEYPEIKEIDINPLLITPDGAPVAVDALIVLGDAEREIKTKPAIPPANVGALFHPRSIAFVGASSVFRKWGQMMWSNAIAGGFDGGIHLVNPKGGEIAGRPVYKSVTEIPDPVDLAVVTIPAKFVIPLLPELEEKGVKSMVLITSGFGETGPEGKELEEKLVDEARRRGIVILGPNTMGICNPHKKFYITGAHVNPKPGPTAFISQSGNMGVQLLTFAEQQGIGIRAFAGSGNEAMLTIEDVMDGFEVDDLTSTVLLYLESVKNGRRFADTARRVSKKKPIVVLKGGRTEAGSSAAASHTGALASNARVFDAACRQAGIILADRSMDLLDLSAAFSSLPLPQGTKVGIMTLGGGWGVVTADLCSEFGMTVPDLSEKIVREVDKILPPYWSRANPIDLVGDTDPSIPIKVMEELMAWDGCDAVINLGIMGRKFGLDKLVRNTINADPNADKEFMYGLFDYIAEFEKNYVKQLVGLMERYGKPIVGVSLLTGADDQTVFDVDGAWYKGIFFPTPERAVKALAEMCRYNQWLEKEGVPLEERGAIKSGMKK